MGWKATSGVFRYKRMSAKLKEKCSKTIVQVAMIYGKKRSTTVREHAQRMPIVKICMLIWMRENS